MTRWRGTSTINSTIIAPTLPKQRPRLCAATPADVFMGLPWPTVSKFSSEIIIARTRSPLEFHFPSPAPLRESLLSAPSPSTFHHPSQKSEDLFRRFLNSFQDIILKSNLAENVGKFLIYLDTIYENIYPNSASIITRKEIYMILEIYIWSCIDRKGRKLNARRGKRGEQARRIFEMVSADLGLICSTFLRQGGGDESRVRWAALAG